MKRFTNPHRLRELMLDRVNRVNEQNERRAEAVTDYEIASAMLAFGGSFFSTIGKAWMCGDDERREKLFRAFPEAVAEYRELARLKRG